MAEWASMKRWPVFLMLLLAVATLALPPTRSLAERAALRVGAIYPLSGNQGEEGAKELAGVRLAAELVNADGGVRGRQVDLDVADAPNADAAPAAADSLLRQGDDIVIGSYGSTISIPASRRVSDAGGVYLETGAVADMVTGRSLPGVLRTVATGSTLGRNAASFAQSFILPHLGLTPATARTVVLYEDDAYGSSVGDGAHQMAAQLGFDIVDVVPYNIATANYPDLAARVDADRPDIILTASYMEDALEFRRAALARHMTVRAIVGTSSAYCLQDFGDALGMDAVGLFASDKPNQAINPSALSSSGRDLYYRATQQYQRETGAAMDAPTVAGFVGGWVLFHDILARAASMSRAAIMAAAMGLDIPYGSEINGAGVKFAPEGAEDAGQNLRAVSVIWEWLAPGKRVVVYPPEYATAAPRLLQITN
jgi:branched-chain amino acid transport system substrate-binding protein